MNDTGLLDIPEIDRESKPLNHFGVQTKPAVKERESSGCRPGAGDNRLRFRLRPTWSANRSRRATQ